MDRYYYLDAEGIIQASGGDVPNWELTYFARVDGTIDGYPENGHAWDFTNEVWYFTKDFLKSNLNTLRNTNLNSTKTFEGMTIYLFGDPFYQHAGMVARAFMEDPEAIRAFSPVNIDPVYQLTNQDIIDAWYFAIDERQKYIDAAWRVSDDIDNDVITEPADVVTAFNAYYGTPIVRTYVKSYYDTVNDVANHEMRIDELEMGIAYDSTITAGGTAGAQTINKRAGSVNFAASASSLVVTNSLVTADSVIVATIATNDANMNSVKAVPASGSFTLYADNQPAAETRVNWAVVA